MEVPSYSPLPRKIVSLLNVKLEDESEEGCKNYLSSTDGMIEIHNRLKSLPAWPPSLKKLYSISGNTRLLMWYPVPTFKDIIFNHFAIPDDTKFIIDQDCLKSWSYFYHDPVKKECGFKICKNKEDQFYYYLKYFKNEMTSIELD